MKLQILKNLLVSYACHINSYNDFKLIKYCVSLLCRHCKLIGISYSINTNIIDDIQIIDTFLSLQKEIPNLMFCCKIENEGYDFGKHFHTINQFKNEGIDDNEYILMINDSIIPINTDLFDKCMHKVETYINEGYEFIGLLASNEIKRHYQSWFWCCNKNTIEWILIQINNITYSTFKQDIILKLEVGLSNYLINNKKCNSLYDFGVTQNIFYHHPDKYIQALQHGFPFLKKNYFSEDFRRHNHLTLDANIVNYLPKNII